MTRKIYALRMYILSCIIITLMSFTQIFAQSTSPATENSLVGPPTTNSICRNEKISLTAVQSGVSDAVYRWYDASSGGTLLYIGQTYTTQALTTRTIYYVSVSGSNVSEGTYRRQVTVNITPAADNSNISAPDNTTVCSGGMALLTATSNVDSPVYRWYNASSGGTLLYTGATYTTPVITQTTTFYVSVSGTNICEGTFRKPVKVTLNQTAGQSNITAPTNTSICSGSTVKLTVSNSGVADPVYRWYSSKTAVSPFHTGNEYTTPVLTSTTLYYISVSGSNMCEGGTEARKELEVKVNPRAQAGNINITGPNNASVCKGTSVQFKATSTGVTTPVYKWYDASGTHLHTGDTYPTSPLAITSTTTYFVSVSGNGLCENNVNNRKAVTVNVNDVSPVVPAKNTLTFKIGDVAPDIETAMGITASSNEHTITWYNNANPNVALSNIPIIGTGTVGLTKYLVSQKYNGCESPKVPVSVLVTNQTTASYVACYSTPLTLGATAVTGISYYWYSSETAGFPIKSNSNTYDIVAVPPQEFWIEPREGTTVFPRFKIDVAAGKNCPAELSECARKGTLIFREDFGGNNASDPAYSLAKLPEGSSSNLGYGKMEYGYYAFVKNANTFNKSFFPLGDHTNLGDISRGYFMAMDPWKDYDKDKPLYETTVKVPCTGVDMSFTAWLIDLDSVSKNPVPQIELQVVSKYTKTPLFWSNTITVGPKGYEWKQYELTGRVDSAEVIFRIVNRLNVLDGNDLGIDDVEIRFCTPPVNITLPPQNEICESENITIKGDFTDTKGTLTGEKKYLWEYSTTGGINDNWQILTEGNTSANIIKIEYTINNFSSQDNGYYRLMLYNVDAAGNRTSCLAISSDPVYLHAVPRAHREDITIKKGSTPVTDIYLCYGETATLTASSSKSGELVYRWYDEEGHFIKTGATLTTPQLEESKTYGVSIEGIELRENKPDNRQTVTVTVIKTEAPVVANTILTYMQFDHTETIASEAGVNADQGCSLKWYLSNGITPFVEAGNPLSTVLPGWSRYYVSQINDLSGCEVGKVAVNVLVVKPEFHQYVICPDSAITLKMEAIPGIDFYWYSQDTGGLPLASKANSYKVKPNSFPKTYYVEPRDGEFVYVRVPVQVLQSEGCGGKVTNCMSEGTLIYKEDFGGNDFNDPKVSKEGLPAGYSDLTFIKPPADQSTIHGNGLFQSALNGDKYTLTKVQRLGWHEFLNIGDHTILGDTTRGYCMVVDPYSGGNGKILYQTVIDNLCSETTLSFSAWFLDLGDYKKYPNSSFPIIEMQMVDLNTGAVLITTDTIRITNKPNPGTWVQKGFEFKLPKGVTAVKFKVINREDKTNGNDLGIDDIEIRFCAPKVNVQLPDVAMACPEKPFTFSGTYTDNGTFGNLLNYHWEYSFSGDINNPSAWSAIPNSDGVSTSGVVSSNLTIPSFGAINQGYYRLVVGSPESINSWVCRSVSKTIHALLQPVSLVWTGKAPNDGNNWNNPKNWYPANTPMSCNTVYIPGNLNNYPILESTAEANDIYFIHGAEVGRPDLLKYNRAFVQYNLGLKETDQITNKSDSNLVINSNSSADRMLYSASVSAAPMQRERWHMISTPLHGALTGDMSFGGFPFSFVQKFGPITKDGYQYQTGNWTTLYTSAVEKLSSKPTDAFAFYMYGFGMTDDNIGCNESNTYGDKMKESDYLPVVRIGKKYGIKEVNGILELPFFANKESLNANRTQVYDDANNTSTFYSASDGKNLFSDFNILTGKSVSVKRESNSGNFRFTAEKFNSSKSVWEFQNTIVHPADGLVKDGYFMVGNPYMSSIDMVEFLRDNENSVHNSFLLWNGDNFISCSIDLGTGNILEADESDMRYTAPLQGFFLKYKGEGGDIEFNVKNISTVRPSGNSFKLRSVQETKEENILRIKAENSYSVSHAVIVFKENTSAGFDKKDDVQKLFSPLGQVPSIYSLASNIPVDINFIGNKSDVVIPLGIKTDQTGETKLTFTGMDNYSKALKIELVDALENKTIDLTKKASYTYSFNNTVKGVTNGRFSLRISTSTTSLIDVNSDNDLKIYGSTKGVYVVSTEPVIKLEVYDLSGIRVYENGMNLNFYPLPANLSNSPLIVKVITKNLVKSEKVNIEL